MNEFLQSTVDKLKSKDFSTLTIVLGNDQCNLASAVSVVTYASYLQWQYNQLRCKLCKKPCTLVKEDVFVPLLNITRDDLKLKPEIKFCFKDVGVDTALLIFRNEHNLKELIYTHKTKVILVDQKTLAKQDIYLFPYICDVIDNGPCDDTVWNFKDDTRSTMDVGSCATLISARIKELSTGVGGFAEYFTSYPESAALLHSTIILDTDNFSRELDEATSLDLEAILFLEDAMKIDENIERIRQRKLIRLVEARKDVSKLTVSQLIRRDVKYIGNIVVASFPITISEFLSKDKSKGALDQYMNSQRCTIVILLGMNLDKPVTKDLAVYCLENFEEDVAELATFLEAWANPYLYLEPKELQDNIIIEHCRYYKQNNVAVTRKHLMNILNEYFNVKLKTTSSLRTVSDEESLNK